MNPIQPLTILIALRTPNDSARMLDTLSATFAASFVIVPEQTALLKTQELLPDFIIVEGTEGLITTKSIKAMYRCYTKCIVCFATFDDAMLVHAIFANADAYFLKTGTNDAIIDCMSRLQGGERYITPSFARNVLQNPKLDNYRKITDKLSIRERDFFRYYGYHYSVKQIADLMFISVNTVNAHKNKIIEKLDLSGSRELKQLAAEMLNILPK